MTRFRRLENCVKLTIYYPELESTLALPLHQSLIPAGFPSPADDYMELQLDLNEHLVQNPSATFFAKVKGHSMEDAGIYEGDILVVDRSKEVRNNDIAVCIINGEFTVKRICMNGKQITLVPESRAYQPFEITEEHQFMVWGLVTYVIHKP
ncbi:translesion error-prone DNA polymerase V autoproteolytic subunit [Porifericola rhodea]|uniref:LexA family protein n=1 Tax=Porifericola rhodea TaxID=930972 RepID=UPI0026668147|nr:translesion error-prone DNA polymerase V autoproteolytic subunit [Porifericola rhodea]WKN32459.1 translesion error-prone DNA polymerase V autoproteolytic subunit [Porifericola rhodea]